MSEVFPDAPRFPRDERQSRSREALGNLMQQMAQAGVVGVDSLLKAAELAKLRPQERLYVACMDMDFSWTDAEVQRVTAWWRNGLPLSDMAERLVRDADEVAILVMDLRRHGRIEKRRGAVWGGR